MSRPPAVKVDGEREEEGGGEEDAARHGGYLGLRSTGGRQLPVASTRSIADAGVPVTGNRQLVTSPDRRHQIRMKIFRWYIQNMIPQKMASAEAPRRMGAYSAPKTSKVPRPRWIWSDFTV